MVQINFAQKTVNVKIVYYGPGMSGKTTNLEIIHQRAPEGNRGDLTSISTDGDRTLFFDYMPLDLGTVAGMRTAFQLYTVPGQVYYNSTRKLVLQGVDGIIFVADSSASMLNQNLESLRNLEENLNEYGKSLATLPHVIQLNKRDLPDAMTVEELGRQLNSNGAPMFEATANSGQGVFPTLKALAANVLKDIMNQSGGKQGYSAPAPARPAAARPAPAQAPAAPRAPMPAAPVNQPSYPAFGAGGHQPAYPTAAQQQQAGAAAAPQGGLQLAQPAIPHANLGPPAQHQPVQHQPVQHQPVQHARPVAHQHARPAPAARPQQRAQAAPKGRGRAPAPAARQPEPKKRGKLMPIFVLAGAGAGAVLAWVLMNVL